MSDMIIPRLPFLLFVAAITFALPVVGNEGVARAEKSAVTASASSKVATYSSRLSDRDLKRYRGAFAAAKTHNWKSAKRQAERASNKLPAKIIRWLEYRRTGANVSFPALTKFIRDNPHWPQQHTLRKNAEYALTGKTPDEAVESWFRDHEPLTGDGLLRLAEMALARDKKEEGLALLRRAWVEGKFPGRRERSILRKHRKVLTKKDHADRLARLLWDRQRRGARRMMRRVDKGHRALAFARLALMEFAGGVDGAIARVPVELRDDPGLVYERVRWRRRKNKPLDAAEMLLPPSIAITTAGPRPKKWWLERHILTRRLLGKDRPSDAYILARDHAQTDRGAIAEAEWLAGWIALKKLRRPEIAAGHFRTMYNVVRFPVSQAKGAYWLARAMDLQGKNELSREWYQNAARHPLTYYGHLAVLALGTTQTTSLARDPQPDEAQSLKFDQMELVVAVRLLHKLKEKDYIRPFLTALADSASDPAEYKLVVDLAREAGRKDRAVATAKRAARSGVQIGTANFPVTDYTGHRNVEKALQLAVTRQESQFDIKAHSHAGALGLMQLMPATAKYVARKHRWRYSRTRLTRDPDYNSRLGTAYLAELLKIYKGSYIMALAAYNAGTPRVKRWVRDYGDPRKPDVDPIDWVEMISISETRNYVQRVMEGLQVYRQRLAGFDQKTRLALLRDLNR
jgi:soluble lytic murein transglycosylase